MKKQTAMLIGLLCLVGTTTAGAAECVVLLHGLGRTSLSMIRLQTSLERSGYVVWNRSYPSTRQPIEQLSEVVGEAVEHCRKQGAEKIHFVTHSLGGILVRVYLRDRKVPEAGRIVMLAPPNHGSEVADTYRSSAWFQWATGPAGQQLGTGGDSLPKRLEPLKLEVGIVAGTKSSDPWFSGVFRDRHDGKVSVASTRLPEMTDFLTVESGHTFIMNSGEVVQQVKSFLRTGAFSKQRVAPVE